MPRPSRKKIKFDEDSVNSLFQEIYNDTHLIRTRIVALFNKWETKVKDNGEVAAIGQEIIKLISEESKTQDRKIALLKILKDVVFNNKKTNDKDSDSDSSNTVSEERRNELIEMVNNATKNKRS